MSSAIQLNGPQQGKLSEVLRDAGRFLAGTWPLVGSEAGADAVSHTDLYARVTLGPGQ